LGADSGVVDHDVQPAKMLHNGLDGGTHRRVIGDIALDSKVGAGFRGEIQDGDLRTSGSEAVRDGRTDAGSPAGHEGC
jgi:hypothetical protein